LLATGWKWPERFSVKARDGVTDLYGVITRPSNFEASKRYPVLDDIYPGPFNIHTPKSFPPGDWHPQAIAQLWFVVVIMDGLGTAFRSKAFHDFSYGNMGDAGGLEDHITGLRQLAARYPYLDLNRVGIYGISAGGYASARAMLAYPDFYKVGVSASGNHDQRRYLADWGEKNQGLLAGDNYLNQANTKLAGNLKGKLLLAYGDMDDNVPPALTIQLADALIKANKDFDLLVLPNRGHDLRPDPYFIRRQWDYFVKHLLGQEPPSGYKIAEPPENN
jgi:dipeptidyl aminopeptidase/acylaminoacyl peptidase